MVSTGYIPKMLTARATAAAAKCDFALIIVCTNDLNISNGAVLVVLGALLVVDEGVVDSLLAAAPPRGNMAAFAAIMAEELDGIIARLIG